MSNFESRTHVDFYFRKVLLIAYCQRALKLFFVEILMLPILIGHQFHQYYLLLLTLSYVQLLMTIFLLSLFLYQHVKIIYIGSCFFPISLTFCLILQWWTTFLVQIIWHCNLLLLYLHAIAKSQYHRLLYNIQRLTFRFFGIHYPVYHGTQLLIMILILIPSGASGKTCFCQWLIHVSQR